LVTAAIALMSLPNAAARAQEPADAASEPAFYATPEAIGADESITAESPERLRDAIKRAPPGIRIRLSKPEYRFDGGNVVFSASGTAAKWIVLEADPSLAEPPVIDLGKRGEFLVSGSYLLITGITIRNGRGNVMHIAAQTQSVANVVVCRCTIGAIDMEGPAGAAIKIRRSPRTGGW
jgi:hypothetical protein